jgi:U3 small nucleolar RNA-associated protein 25
MNCRILIFLHPLLYHSYYPFTTMSTDTEVKLLTLLNVAAIKKPRDLDIPGGQRGSPALNSRTASPVPAPALKAKGAKANGNGVKKRKSVIFGGELGPSGSTFGKKAKAEVNGKENGNNKGKGKEVDGTANGNGNGEVSAKSNGHVDIDLDEGSDDEGAAVTSELSLSRDRTELILRRPIQ